MDFSGLVSQHTHVPSAVIDQQWDTTRKTAGIVLISVGSLAVIAGAVTLVCYVHGPFAQTLRLEMLNRTLIGRSIMIGCLGAGTIMLAIGGYLLYTPRPTSKKQPPPEEATPPAPQSPEPKKQLTVTFSLPAAAQPTAPAATPPPTSKQTLSPTTATPPPTSTMPLSSQRAPSLSPSRPVTPKGPPVLVMESLPGSNPITSTTPNIHVAPPSPRPSTATLPPQEHKRQETPSRGPPRPQTEPLPTSGSTLATRPRSNKLSPERGGVPLPRTDLIPERGDSFSDAKGTWGRVHGARARASLADKPGHSIKTFIEKAHLKDPQAVSKIAEIFNAESSDQEVTDALTALGMKFDEMKKLGKPIDPALFVAALSEYKTDSRSRARNSDGLFRLLTYWKDCGICEAKDDLGQTVLGPTSPQIVNATLTMLNDPAYKEMKQANLMPIIEELLADNAYSLDHFRKFLTMYVIQEYDANSKEKPVVKVFFNDLLARPHFIEALANSTEVSDRDLYTFFMLWVLETNRDALGGNEIPYLREPYEELKSKRQEGLKDEMVFKHPLLKTLQDYLKQDLFVVLRISTEREFKTTACYALLGYFLRHIQPAHRSCAKGEKPLLPMDHPRVINALINLCKFPQDLGNDAQAQISAIILETLSVSNDSRLIFGELMLKYAYWENNKELHKDCQETHVALRDLLLKYLAEHLNLLEWANRLGENPTCKEITLFLQKMNVKGFEKRDPSRTRSRPGSSYGSRPGSGTMSRTASPAPGMPDLTGDQLNAARKALSKLGEG